MVKFVVSLLHFKDKIGIDPKKGSEKNRIKYKNYIKNIIDFYWI